MRSFFLLALLVLTVLIFSVPNVRAQTTSITTLQAPSVAFVGQSVTVTVSIAYALGPQGYAVSVGIFDLDAWWATGTASSAGNTCLSTLHADDAYCGYVPTLPLGSDVVTFQLTFNSVKTYRLRASVEIYNSNAQVISGASTFQDFSITVSQNIPTVQPQTTSITITQVPTHAMMQTSGVTRAASGTMLVSYSDLPTGEYLGFGILYEGTKDFVTGSIESTPDSCYSLAGTVYANAGFCVTSPKSSSGLESVSFSLKLNETGQVTLRAFATMGALVTIPAMSVFYGRTGSAQIVPGSMSTSDFTISVTNNLELTIDVPNAVSVAIDGTTETPGNVILSLSPNAVHTISVPPIVPIGSQSRLRFDHWSDGSTQANRTEYLQNDTSLTASYVTQYPLTLTDPSATGAGWYDQGSVAQFSIPSSESAPGMLGILGGTQTFQGWYENGTLVSSSNTSSMTMNAPHTLDTQWAVNNSMPIGIVLFVLFVAAVAFYTLRRRNTTQTTNPPPTSVGPSKAVGQFCISCGTALPAGAKFCNRCGTQQP